MTLLPYTDVHYGGQVDVAHLGVRCHKNYNFGALIKVFKPNAQNIQTFVLSQPLQQFQPNFAE